MEIPDPDLRHAIEHDLRLSGQPIGSGDLAGGIGNLKLEDGGGVADLTGLEWAFRLHTLHLRAHDLTDIAPLSGLEMLREVILGDNRIEDLAPLAAATALHDLSVDGNRITDIAPLANARALYALTVERNAIADIGPLQDMTELVFLQASHNEIADVSALSDMKRLSVLTLASNRIEDVSALAQLSTLSALELQDNAIADIEPLGALTSLRHLDIGGNAVVDLGPLRQLTDLRTLDVRHSPLSAESREVHIPALRAAGVSVTWISDDVHGDTRETPTPLASGQWAGGRIEPYYDTDYFRLDVDETDVFDVFTTGAGAVRGRLLDAAGRELARGNADASTANFLIRRRLAPGTYYIEVTAHYVSGRGPIRYWLYAATDVVDVEIPDPALRAALEERLHKNPGETITSAEMAIVRQMRFGARDIADLTGLEFATGLTELYLASNDISDVGPLAGLTDLTHLYLQNNRIVDISPLATLTGLRTLDLGRNDIEDLAPIRHLPHLEWLNVSHNPLSDESADVHLPALAANGVDVQESDDMHGDELATATPIALGDVVHGRIHPDYDIDLFRLDLDSSVRAGFVAPDGGLTLRLLDETGAFLADSEPLPMPSNRILQRRIGPGTFYVEIGGVRGYTLRVVHAVDVAFADPDLAARVKSVLGRDAQASVTAAEMAALVRLYACCGIADLTGLEFAVALRVLELPGNAFSDLAPLAGLTELTELNLVRNRIADLTPLAALSRLEYLDLTGNEIVDIAPLANLAFLSRLAAADNRIRDISALEGLERLSDLDLGGNEIEDIAPLTRMAALRTVGLWNNPLSDESIERHVPALVGRGIEVFYLDDHGNAPEAATQLVLGDSAEGWIRPYYDTDWFELEIDRAWDIAIVAHDATFRLLDAGGRELARAGSSRYRVHQLSRRMAPGTYFLEVRGLPDYVGFYRIGAAEIAPIPDAELRAALRTQLRKDPDDEITTLDMASVTDLHAGGLGVRNLAGLEFAPRLERLDLSRNRVRDLSPLETLQRLRELSLADNEIADIAALAGLAELQRLDLARNAITDLAPLAALTRLRHLDLSDNRVGDIAPLAGLAELTHLNLNGNTIGDISVLAPLAALEELRLSHNAIRDVSPLAGLRALRELDLSDNGVSDIGPLAGLASLTFLDLRRNPLNARAAEAIAPFLRRGVDVGVVDPHDDDPETGTTLAFGDTVTGRLEPAGDRDYFRLEVSEDVDAVFFTTGDLDTAGWLFDAQGREVAQGFSTGLVNRNLFFSHPLAPGVYSLRVQGAPPPEYGATYALTVRSDAIDVPDPVLREALPPLFGRADMSITVSDLIALRGLAVWGSPLADLTGLELALNLEALVLHDNQIIDIAPLLDVPRLRFVDLRGNPLDDESVDVHLPALRGRGVWAVTGDDHGDRPETATRLTRNGHAEGIVYPIADRDFFRIVLPRQGDLTLFTTGAANTVGRLFNAAGDLVAEDDDSGDDRNFRIARHLPRGIYDLEVGAHLSGSFSVPGPGLGYAPYAVHADAFLPPPPTPAAHASAELDGTALVVVWNAFAGHDVTRYRVHATPGGGGETATCETVPSRRRCVFDGLLAGETYEVTVEALRRDGTAATFTTLSTPAGVIRSMWRGWRLELLRERARGTSSADAPGD